MHQIVVRDPVNGRTFRWECPDDLWLDLQMFSLASGMTKEAAVTEAIRRLTMSDALVAFKSDKDWRAAFAEAHGQGYSSTSQTDDESSSAPNPIDAVIDVIAASEGERDERDWLAIVRVIDGDYLVVSAGCDFTGWDCQAGGVVERYQSLGEACSRMALTPRERDRLADQLRARTDVVLDWPEQPEALNAHEYDGGFGRRDKRLSDG